MCKPAKRSLDKYVALGKPKHVLMRVCAPLVFVESLYTETQTKKTTEKQDSSQIPLSPYQINARAG